VALNVLAALGNTKISHLFSYKERNFLYYLLPYVPNTMSRVLPDKLTVPQLIKEFPTLHGI